jgi:putative tryptophan/tyrosine transport system substrate-binding protein
MKRREFITLLGGAAASWPLAVRAQQGVKVWRIGFLASAPPTPAMLSTFRGSLSELGYVEGQNLSIEVRWPPGPIEQNLSVAAELVHANVDVIVAWASPAVIAARRATSTIPIVMVSVGDPLGSGFIASLARPGGNITGVSNISRDLSGKLVELLVELVPDMKRVGVLRNPDNPVGTVMLRETEEAIRRFRGLQLDLVEAKAAGEFESAFARLSTQGVTGVVLLADPSLIEHRMRIAELAQKTRLATVFQRRENVEAGGLLSYGPSLNGQLRQAAFYVDRIFKGAKPADLPVDQPTKFELVINLKTAKALGLTVPESFLLRADEVIE